MKKYLLPLLLSITFFVSGVLTLSDYGINWDAPLSMLRGQAYAHFYLTGQTKYDQKSRLPPNLITPHEVASRFNTASSEKGNIEKGWFLRKVELPQRPLPQADLQPGVSFYRSQAWNGQYFIENDWEGHMPLMGTLSAFSNRIFWGYLGWLGDIESYQFVYILISTLGVFIVSLFAYEITGSYVASLVSGLSLGLFPIFFAESHINAKDPSQAVFFLGSIWVFYHWVKSSYTKASEDKGGLGPTSSPLRLSFAGRARLRRVKWFGVFIAFVALALAVKWNIVFLPLILIPWLFTIRKTAEFKAWFKIRQLGVLGGLGLLGVVLFLIAVWPYAWVNPLSGLLSVSNFYLDLGSRESLFRLQSFVPLLLLFQTPEIILILGLLGGVWAIREKGGELKIGYLLLLWILVTIARTATPTTWYYGEIRQIMEVIPAMALLAGLGAERLVRVVGGVGVVRGEIKIITVITIITVILVFPIVKLHPNQNAYFNVLLGGLKGAKEKGFVDWGITYGNIYKQGVLWLNKNAQKDANLAYLQGADFAISPLWLRDDISISPYHFSGFDQKGEYIFALYNPLDPPVFANRYPKRFLKPVHEVEVDGVPLLTIYQNDPAFNLINLENENELRAVKMEPVSSSEGDFWQINLGKTIGITRIVLQNADPKCIEWVENNEFIVFSDNQNPYVVNEKQLEEGKVVYLFPKEPAHSILIFPQNSNSCFNKQQIVSIKYLDI